MSLDFDSMELEPLTEMTVEAFADFSVAYQRCDEWKDRLVRMLESLKRKVGHGKWETFRDQHFGHLASVRTLQVWMRSARKADELTAICMTDSPAETKSAESALLKTGQVTVVEPSEEDDTEPEPEHEADTPSVDPPTNRKTSQESQKVSESKKPKTAPITPEIVEPEEDIPTVVRLDDIDALIDACCRTCRPTQILRVLVSACAPESAAELGKLLRKAADTVDPPADDKIPTAAQCVSEIPEDFESDLRDTAEEWARYKQSRPRGDKIQSIRAWRIALKAFRKYPKHVVISNVEKAIASSWKGWEPNDTKNGKAADQLYRNPGPRAPVKYDNVPN
jgi:hypothetical protein